MEHGDFDSIILHYKKFIKSMEKPKVALFIDRRYNVIESIIIVMHYKFIVQWSFCN